MSSLTIGSLFSGIGGLELGLERAGMKVLWQSEIDDDARAVLKQHWPDTHCYEDVRDVKSAKSIDVICGGFPCQDYSDAGRRSGLAGDRGALWWEMHRVIAECRPTWIVGENVPGLLASNGGMDFGTIISSLVGWDVPTPLGGWGNAGLVQGRSDHYGIVYGTLDSQYFGVPQRRRRLFIVGHSGGVARPEILALSEGLFGHSAPGTGSWLCPSSEVGQCVEEGGSSQVGPIAFHPTQDPIHGPVSPALGVTTDGMACLNVTATDNVPRRLTPVECERLQGFPDDWTRYGLDNKLLRKGTRYQMLGNAVTVNVAEWIGQQIS